MREKKRLKLRPHYLGIGGIFVAMVGIVTAVAAVSGKPEESHAAGQGIQDGMYMQNITPEICANTPVGDTQYTVIDKRDDKPYTVARIANKEGGGAHCWMTSNLAFDVKNQASKMTEDLSDVTTSKSSWATSDVTIQLGKYSSSDNAKAVYTNSTPSVIYSTSGPYQTTYGYYYSWCAATAGTCSNTTADQPGARSATMSICPKGWKLPTGGSGGQFTDLLGADTSNSGITVTPHPTSAPYNYLLSGGMGTYGFVNGGTNGLYWSSSSRSDTNAYRLGMDSSTVWPASSNYRYYGYSVRCVAEAPSFGDTGITYMQEMTADVCSKVATGTTGSLIDKRDGKLYSIAKIADKVGDGENCWMTQNLQLDLEQYWNAETMTTALSDVPSNSYFSDIGAATKKNQGFTISSSNYNAIEYTNTTTTGSAENQLKINSGTYDPSYGYYYTWCAATVGCKDSSGNIPSSGDVVASICPKGWQLPSGNTNGQWYNLLNGTSKPYIDNLAADPYKIPAAGYMYSDGFNDGGTSGGYWSRTANDTNNAYRLSFYSSNFNPGTGNTNRYLGYSVRCVNNPDVHGLPESPNKDSASADFSVTVNDAITLSSVEFSNSDGTSNTISAMPGQLATGNINVNVGSNVKYKITMNSASPDLASKTGGNTNVIPSITTTMTADQLKTNYGWGVLKKNTDNTTDDTVYTGLNSTDQTFYTSDEPAGASKVTSFGVGVGVPPTIPADTYSTEVTITAIATE